MARTTRSAVLAAAAAVSVALTALTGCGAADMTRQASPYADAKGSRTVTLSVQSWV
ncbi:glycine/betaine ABC transporter substrate-binding protein, partial [Streptomyces cadmiisoli]